MYEKIIVALEANRRDLRATLNVVRAYRLRSEIEVSGLRARRDAEYRNDVQGILNQCKLSESFLTHAIATINSDLEAIQGEFGAIPNQPGTSIARNARGEKSFSDTLHEIIARKIIDAQKGD